MSFRNVLRRWRSYRDLATLFRYANAVKDIDEFESLRPASFATETRRGGLADAEVESAFLRRFRDVQKNPDANEVAHLFDFLASESTDLNGDPVFADLCDFAATVAGGFDAADIELIFRICYKKLDVPHCGLLQSIADVLMGSNDLTPFPSWMLVRILTYISRRRRQGTRSTRQEGELQEFFPEENVFVRMLLDEVTQEERLNVLEASDAANAFCSAAALEVGMTKSLARLKKKISKQKTLQKLQAKEIAHLAYLSVMFLEVDIDFLMTMAYEFPKTVATSNGLQYLGMMLYSLAKCKEAVKVPSKLAGLCGKMQKRHIEPLVNADLACLFYSLGQLSLKNHHLLQILSAEVKKKSRLESMEGQQLLSVLHAIQQLRHTEDLSLISALSHEVLVGRDQITGLPRIQQFKTFEVCGILHAFSRMGMSKEWSMQALMKELIRKERHKDLTKDAVGLMVHAMGLTRIWDKEVVSYLKAKWLKKDDLKHFEDQLLSMMISGLSRFPRACSYAVMHPIVDEMIQRERLKRCSNITLTSVIHGLASVEYGNRHPVMALFKEATEPKRIESMSERSLSLMIYSLGKLPCLKDDGRKFCSPFVEMALKPHRLTRMDNQGLSNLILGLSKLKYQPDAHLKQFAWELLKPHRLDGLKAKGYVQLSHTIFALGSLRVQKCDAILDTISEFLLKNGVRSIATEGIAYVVSKLAQLNYQNVEIYTALVREAIRREGMRKLKAEDLPMIVESIGYLKFRPLFTELVTSGLRELENLNRYQPADLKRLLNGFVAMNGAIRPDLMHKLEKRLSQLNELRSQSAVLAVK